MNFIPLRAIRARDVNDRSTISAVPMLRALLPAGQIDAINDRLELLKFIDHLRAGLERAASDCGCREWCSCAVLAANSLLGELDAREGK